MNKFRTLLIFFVLTVSFLSIAESSDTEIDSLVDRGLIHLKTEMYDSALYCFQSAYRQGMSEDSLYFLWSVIYVTRGVVDTALALNLATQADVSEPLRGKILEQRYLIYSSLGWSKEAGKVLDSISGKSWKRRLVPDFTLEAGPGYLLRTSRPVYYLPYDDIEPVVIDTDNLPGGSLRSALEWRFPVSGRRAISFGTQGIFEQSRFSKPFRIGDSLQYEIKTHLKTLNLIDNVNIEYAMKNRRNYLGINSNTHNFGISSTYLLGKWVHYYAASAEFEHGEDVKNVSNFSLNAFNSRIVNRMVSLNIFSRASVLKSESFEFEYDPGVNLFYYHNEEFFLDSSFTSPIDVNNRFQISNIKDNLIFSTFIPENRIEFSLSKGLSITRSALKLGLNVGYGVNYYTEEHHWYRLGYSSTYLESVNTDVPSFGGSPISVVYDPHGEHYLVVGFDEPRFTLDDEPLSVSYVQKRRVDNILHSSFSLAYDFGLYNALHLRVNMRRTFTNLPQSAPVEIKPYIFQLRLNWVLKLKNMRD